VDFGDRDPPRGATRSQHIVRVEPLLLAALRAGAVLLAFPSSTALAHEDPTDVERLQPTRVAATRLESPSATLALEVPWALLATATVAHGSPKLVGTWALTSSADSTRGVGLRSEAEVHTEHQAVSLRESTAATSIDLWGGAGPVEFTAGFGPRLGAELEWTYEAAIAIEARSWLSVGARMNGVAQRRLEAHEAFGGAAFDLTLPDDVVVSAFAGRGLRTEPYLLPNWMVWSGATLPF
jgi:hypothetical protein